MVDFYFSTGSALYAVFDLNAHADVNALVLVDVPASTERFAHIIFDTPNEFKY